MPKRSEEIFRTSPSLARLMRQYTMYCRECMEEGTELLELRDFYFLNKKINFPKSLIYEQYLRDLNKMEVS